MLKERGNPDLLNLLNIQMASGNNQMISDEMIDYIAPHRNGILKTIAYFKHFPNPIIESMTRPNQLLLFAGLHDTLRFDGLLEEAGKPVQALDEHIIKILELHRNRNVHIPKAARYIRRLQHLGKWNEKDFQTMAPIHDISEIIIGDHNQANGETPKGAVKRHKEERRIFHELVLPLFPPETHEYLISIYARYQFASLNPLDPVARYVKFLDRLEGKITANTKAAFADPDLYTNPEVINTGNQRLKEAEENFYEACEYALFQPR